MRRPGLVDNLRLLSARYPVAAPPLLLVMAVAHNGSSASSNGLMWTAAALVAALTVNWAVFTLARREPDRKRG